MTIRFDGRVAIVTGAGNGLGRSHALGLAARGAKVVIVDFGGARDGTGGSSEAADKVVAEIVAAGGEAMAHGANVADFTQVQDMVAKTMARWGRIDILVNNAGILRDKTFAKMELADFEAVMAVHVMGTVNCTKAVWEIMRTQNYGRIVFTSSSSGLYGNFGQSNYGAAKAAMVGLMNVLHMEGAKNDIRVNTLAPTAATRMTSDLMAAEALALLTPESITPGVLFLVSDKAPSRVILCAGAGAYARTIIYETDGIYLDEAERTPETIAARFDDISNPNGQKALQGAFEQTTKFAMKAAAAKGVTLPPR
ncbi:SDR family NAD(P)-dependent oxidoreductase [Phreatobacter stygius]|uniref:SDR family NAD(P)-dependent oxidoreductase n=1 Tax=Phreatobacter stygius TaxID=1940610 RepID=A0A4D7B700_9HYPH|nr:SDR family NAD(P)-dependent oxidoreductase [Phreatobacter stygius]QCI65466.1 SDR family NAD(P)-dependent oxidoreductase [Phreatobacter stygius]